jgi:hypothetical protein
MGDTSDASDVHSIESMYGHIYTAYPHIHKYMDEIIVNVVIAPYSVGRGAYLNSVLGSFKKTIEALPSCTFVFIPSLSSPLQ